MRKAVALLNFSQPSITEDTIAAMAETMRSGWIASGPRVLEFERALSATFGGRPTRTLTSATGAMELALLACGIGPGDEVITSTQSFFSTMNMIVKVGARPVFVDCDLVTRAIALDQVEAAITPRTRAIVPTHFPGALGDMDALYALARRHGLRVIEDAALVQGSAWKGRPVGSFGDIATFSFHPNKNMTTIEGGAIVVPDEETARRIEVLRFHGIERLPDDTRDVAAASGKYNMSDVSAAIGLAQLALLPGFLAHRRRLADRYAEVFPRNRGRRAATRRRGGAELEHVLRPAALRRPRHHAPGLPRRAARARHRDRAVLRALAPDDPGAQPGLPPRAIPERRTDRRRDGDLAAALRDGHGRRRPGLRCHPRHQLKFARPAAKRSNACPRKATSVRIRADWCWCCG
jgi:dTDP-4-amino-4,6-dideoxygalactose transaminase